MPVGAHAGRLSTRDYRVGLEPVGAQVTERARATSRSAVGRRFVARTQTALAELLAADLSAIDPVAILVDGVGHRTAVSCLSESGLTPHR